MTNQTIIYSALGYDATSGIAAVNERVNVFMQDAIKKGWMNFRIHKVVITPETKAGVLTDRLLFTVQVDYYAPEIM